MSDVEKVLAERSEQYGDAQRCHECIGRVWGAILSFHGGIYIGDIPPNIVAMMMAGLKVIRASSEKGSKHADNYLDLKGYTTIAESICVPSEERPIEPDRFETLIGRLIDFSSSRLSSDDETSIRLIIREVRDGKIQP